MEITVPAAPKPPERRGGRGSVNIIKVILYLFRRKPGKTRSVPLLVSADGKWQRFVGSMRPMHVQAGQSPPMQGGYISPDVYEPLEDAVTPLLSPSVDVMGTPGMSVTSSSIGRDSLAAVNVHELGLCEAEETVVEESECGMDDGGDEMIDAKAAEFIAKFYDQMRLQS